MKSKLANTFLEEFVKSLIRNSKPRYHLTIKSSLQEPTIDEFIPFSQERKKFQISELEIPIKKPMMQIQKPMPRFQQLPKIPIPKTPAQIDTDLGRISQILIDPAVQSIECTGPGKPVLVNRSGVIQTSSVFLNSEEIKSIVENFAEKARIPLAGKVFKAAVNNVIITAILSDFIGTRFLIEKRIPQFASAPQ